MSKKLKPGVVAILKPKKAPSDLVLAERKQKDNKDLQDLLNTHKALVWQSADLDGRMNVAQMLLWKFVAIYEAAERDDLIGHIWCPVLLGVIDELFREYVKEHEACAIQKGDKHWPTHDWWRLYVADRLKTKILKKDKPILLSFVARGWGPAPALVAVQAKNPGATIQNGKTTLEVVETIRPPIKVIYDENEYQQKIAQDAHATYKMEF